MKCSKQLAATGKIIRITELDVRHTYEPTANPSAEQLMKQADVYRWIIESYKENVPATQQSGFTIWTFVRPRRRTHRLVHRRHSQSLRCQLCPQAGL
ncbi:MAG: endo-1,4-beta-xylanase [Bacteroides cellulosilyticus]